MNSMKRQKDRTLKDELPRSVGTQYATGDIRLENNSSVQFSRSVVSDSVTPWTAARQASLSITNSRSLLKLMSIEYHTDLITVAF